MKQLKALYVAAAAFPLLLAGCSTPQAQYVEANGPRTLATVGQINIQDFASAADTMVNSLIAKKINSGIVKSAVPGEPALFAMSRIVNSTSQQFDTDLLVKKIRVALLDTGKVATTTTIGLGGPEDPLAAQLQQQNGTPTRRPDYTLTGKIIEQYTRVGNLRQSAYVFQMSLTSTTGVAIWEEEKTIVKQGKQAAVGY